MNKKRARLIILLVVFADMLGFGLVIPLLPFVAQEFGATATQIGFLASVFPLMQLVSLSGWGHLSDRTGRRPVILASLAGSLVSYVVFVFARSVPLLLLSRLVAGIMSANISVAKAYLVDISEPEELSLNMGLYGAAMGLGFLLGPAAGGALSKQSLQLPVVLASALLLIILIFAFIFVKEPPVTRQIKTEFDFLGFKATTAMIRRPAVGVLILVICLSTLSFAHLFVGFPLLTQRLFGFGAPENAIYFVAMAFVAIIVQGFMFPKLSRNVSQQKLFVIGSLFLGAGMLVLSQITRPFTLWIVTALVSGGYGLLYPAALAMTTKAVREDEQGLIAGISESAASLGRVVGPAMSGLIIGLGHVHGPFYSATGFLILTLVIFAAGRRAII